MEADGGIDLNELETLLAKVGLKPSTTVIGKFNELDTNKNGKIEKSEVESEGSGEDYFNPLWGAVIAIGIGTGTAIGLLIDMAQADFAA